MTTGWARSLADELAEQTELLAYLRSGSVTIRGGPPGGVELPDRMSHEIAMATRAVANIEAEIERQAGAGM